MNRSAVLASVVSAVVTAVLVGGGIAIASGDDSDVLHACARNKNGQLRLVDSEDDCRRKETEVSWGITGPQGPPGPSGGSGVNCDLELRIRGRLDRTFPLSSECEANLPIIELVSASSTLVDDVDGDGVFDAVQCALPGQQDLLRAQFVVRNVGPVAADVEVTMGAPNVSFLYVYETNADSSPLSESVVLGVGETVTRVLYLRGYGGANITPGVQDSSAQVMADTTWSRFGDSGEWNVPFQVEVTKPC